MTSSFWVSSSRPPLPIAGLPASMDKVTDVALDCSWRSPTRGASLVKRPSAPDGAGTSGRTGAGASAIAIGTTGSGGLAHPAASEAAAAAAALHRPKTDAILREYRTPVARPQTGEKTRGAV